MKKVVCVCIFLLSIGLVSCKKEDLPYTFSFNDSKDNVRNPVYLSKDNEYTLEGFTLADYGTVYAAVPIREESDYQGVISILKTKKTYTFTIKRIEQDPFYNAYPSINTATHHYEVINYEQLMALFNEGSHIVYLGFPRCPWCMEYVVYFNEVAKELNKSIHYYDFQDIRKIENGALTVEFQGLVDKIDPIHLKETTSLGTTYPWLFAPTILIIKEGVVIGSHSGAYQGHVALQGALSKKEKNAFIAELKVLFSK